MRTRKLCTRVSMAIMLAPTSLPAVQAFGGGQQDAGQGHGQDLVRHAVDLPERSNQGFPQSGQPVGARRVIGMLELLVDPADQVAVGNVAHEQE